MENSVYCTLVYNPYLSFLYSFYSEFGSDIEPHRSSTWRHDGGCRGEEIIAAVHRAAQPGRVAGHRILRDLHLPMYREVHHRVYYR